MTGQNTKPSRLERLPGWMRFVWNARRRYTHRNGPLNAAGLAYVAFLSLAPLALFILGMAAIVLGTPDAAQKYFTDVASRMFPSVAKTLSSGITGVVESRHAVGVIGLIGLGVSGTAFFRSTEEALISLWDAKCARGFVTSVLIGLAATFISVFLAGGSVAATVLANIPSEWTTTPVFASAAGWVVSVFCKGLALYCIYHWLPPSAPSTRANMLVSALTAIVMELTKPLFTLYVSHFGNYGVIYGPISAVVVSLVYLYILLVVFLMAAAVLAELDAGKQPA